MTDHDGTLRLGVRLAKVGRYEEAAEKFMEAIEQTSEDPRGWFGLGVCCVRTGKLEDGREALLEAKQFGHPKAQELLDKLQRPRGSEAPGAAVGMPHAHPSREAFRATNGSAAGLHVEKTTSRGPVMEKVDLGKRVRIMLVEDKADDRAAICEALHKCLARVAVVESPFAESASRTIVRTGIFDIAIIDWNTSPKHARELLEFLKTTQPHIPVIVLTGTWREEMAREAIQAGADYCLVKASGFAGILPFVIEQRFKQSYALQEKIETDLGDLYQEARRRYFDSMEHLAVLVDQDGRVIDVNEAAVKVLGTPRDQLIGEECERLFQHAPEQESFLPLANVFANGRQATVERWEPRLGRCFRITTVPVKGEEKTEYLSILEDVTEHGKQHDQPAELLVRAVDQLEMPVFCKDADARFVFANAAFARTLNRHPSELLGRTESQVGGGPRAEEHEARERKTIKNGETVVFQEQHGSRWLSYEVSPVRDDKGEVVGVVGTARDVADAAPGVARDGVADLLQLAGLAAEAAFELNDKGCIVRLSAAAARLLGCRPHELDGVAFEQVVAADSRPVWRDAHRRVLERGESVAGEQMNLCRSNGGVRPGLLSLAPVRVETNGSVAGMVGILVDVTDRKRIEKAISILQGEQPLS